jgi:hypothetical protein
MEIYLAGEDEALKIGWKAVVAVLYLNSCSRFCSTKKDVDVLFQVYLRNGFASSV